MHSLGMAAPRGELAFLVEEVDSGVSQGLANLTQAVSIGLGTQGGKYGSRTFIARGSSRDDVSRDTSRAEVGHWTATSQSH